MANGKPTLRDVAAEAGVSPMTASNALHGKAGVKESTRAKVLAAAKKLDYRINLTASMLKSGRSNIIHIIVNEFDSPFYSKLTQTLSREITSRGLTPFIEQTQYSPDAAEHALTSNPFSGQLFDGEILHATGLGTNLPLAKLNGGRPLVLLDACEETPTVDAVNFPNEEGERAAMQYLIAQGCRNIAIVGHTFVPRASWRMRRTHLHCDFEERARRCWTQDCHMTKPWCSKAVAPTKALPPGTRSPNGSWRREGRAAEPARVLETAKQARPEPPISTMQAARLRADRSKRPTRFPQSRSTECAAPMISPHSA